MRIFFKILLIISFILSILSIFLGYSNIVLVSIIYFTFHFLLLSLLKLNTNLKVLSTSILFSLILLEIGLNIFIKQEHFNYFNPLKKNNIKEVIIKLFYDIDDIHFHNSTPNTEFKYFSVGEFSYTHFYNSLGFREREIKPVLTENKYSILCLGDSFTEGAGAPADSTWSKILEKQDKKNNILTISAGSISCDPLYDLYKLESKLYKYYQPKHVMLTVNKTDILDIIENGGFNRFDDKNHLVKLDAPWWSFFYTFSPLSRYCFNTFLNWNENGPNEETEKKEMESMQILKETILKFKNHALINNYRFSLILIPLRNDIDKKDTFTKILADFAFENNIESLDFQDYINKRNLKYNSLYWGKDSHLNSKGYALLGEEVYKQFILKEIK